jgi:hypothetical protein
MNMSITVLCPQGHALTIDDPHRDHACPRCGSVITSADVPGIAASALPGGMAARPESRKRRDEDEDEDEDDRPRRRKPRDDDDEEEDRPRRRKDERVQAGPPIKRRDARAEPEYDEEDDEEGDEVVARKLTRKQKQLSMVRLGILFHMIKLWLYLASVVFGFIALPLVIFAAMTGSIIVTLLLQVTFNLGMTVAPICGITGSIMCAFCPPRSEARGTIIVSLIFDILAPFFGLFQLIMWLGFFATLDDRVMKLINYMLYARMACTLVAWWLFQLFLRKVAFYMRETLLASESLNVIVHFLMATVITPSLLVGTIMVALFMPGILVLILFFATLGWMIYMGVTFPIRQFRLLFLMRAKIWDKFLKPDDDD